MGNRDARHAFTILELLIFIAIFTLVMVAFTTILIVVTQVQTQQVAQNEVTQQSQFLLQQIQYYVEQSSIVDVPQDTATTTLTLRMANAGIDPTVITLASGTVYLQQGGGALQPLNSSKVAISNLSFIKRSNAPSHDSVSVNFTVAYNSANVEQAFAQMLQTSVERVSAANFDSNVLPSSTNSYVLGNSSNRWLSIDGIIYFSGSNVGIGVSSPGQTLEVNGGMRIDPQASGQPTCSVATDGTFWVVQGGSGVQDNVQVCAKDNTNTYAWRTLY